MTSPAAAPTPRSMARSTAAARSGTSPPSDQLTAASTSAQVAPATRPPASPRTALRRIVTRSLLALPEAPDDVEGRPSPVAMHHDRHADAEETPEEDLNRRIVEGVEVAHRDEEAEAGGEDCPQNQPEAPVAHRAAPARDRRQRRADHPHHQGPADDAGAPDQRQVHVRVAHHPAVAVALVHDLDQADGTLAGLGSDEDFERRGAVARDRRAGEA